MTNNFRIFWSERFDGMIMTPSNTVLALGTFDGVHVAHRQLLTRAIALKNEIKADFVGSWCFEQSPASVLKDVEIPSLTTLEQKVKIMLESGLDFVAVGNFKNYCHVSAENFIDNTLIDKLGCVGTVCGFNHRFGYKGYGNASLLKNKFSESNVIEVNELTMFEETISSTSIREYILSGNIEKANAMLGRTFSIESPIVHGKQLGRKLNFPTANQFFPSDLIVPKHGVYATICTLENGEKHVGVSNVGIRPTISNDIDSHTANCETYLCDFSGEIYGQKLKVEFCSYLREEKVFSSIDDLSTAIAQDKINAVNFFKTQKIIL